jgi:hypothetical protein
VRHAKALLFSCNIHVRASKRKVPHPYSRALHIYAQKRRANGGPNARVSLTGVGMTNFLPSTVFDPSLLFAPLPTLLYHLLRSLPEINALFFA